MSGCGGNDPCAPVNPCDCAETADIREQGPPGSRGLPGGIPVFQIGSVISGNTPSVTLVKVNPLLYTLNFVVPSSGTNIANLWTAIQTFQQTAVFQDGFNASGASTIFSLNVSNDFMSSGTSLFIGISTFNGTALFNDGIVVTGGATIDDLEVTGDIILSGITELGAGECIKGDVFMDSCGKLRYITGGFPNSADNAGSFSTTLTTGTAETAMPVNTPFVIPSSCACGNPLNAEITVRGRLDFTPSARVSLAQDTSPPYTVTAGVVNISGYQMQIRLDNATTGTIIYSSIVSNLDSSRNFLTVQGGITPGAHTAYVTLRGLGVGSENITAINLSLTVEW